MKRIFAVCLLVFTSFAVFAEEESIELRVMSKNILFTNKSTASQKALIESIRKADIVGCQELNFIKAWGIAKKAGYKYFTQSGLKVIFSKYPIIERGYMREGIKVELPNGKQVWVFNLHLPPSPYGPYELNQITGIFGGQIFDPTNEQQVEALVERQRKTRIDAYEGRRFAKAYKKAKEDNIPIFVTGDFNEPSHLDWTEDAVEAGMFPVVLPWPASIRMAEWGFKDSFRVLNPDPVAVPGFTWTCDPDQQTNKNAKGETITEPFDRIDFVYYQGEGVTPLSVTIFGPEGDERCDEVIPGHASDHRSVMTIFEIK
jgi:exonuclease III